MIVGGEKVPGSVIEAGAELRVISVHGVGTDNIDLKTATDRGVLVCNAPGTNTNAVAELALGLMLASARRIPYADRQVRSGTWGQCIGSELAGKVLGIVGLGKIGQSLASILLPASDLKGERHGNDGDRDCAEVACDPGSYGN